jgi:hypothetical protein
VQVIFVFKIEKRSMATYECRICGITRNDSFISKIGTPKKCMQPNFKVKISSHSWKKISEKNEL